MRSTRGWIAWVSIRNSFSWLTFCAVHSRGRASGFLAPGHRGPDGREQGRQRPAAAPTGRIPNPYSFSVQVFRTSCLQFSQLSGLCQVVAEGLHLCGHLGRVQCGNSAVLALQLVHQVVPQQPHVALEPAYLADDMIPRDIFEHEIKVINGADTEPYSD